MKRILITSGIAITGVAAVMAFAGASAGGNTDGKSLFVSNKCNTCHTVSAQGIARAGGSSDAPDLSGTGKRHNAAWFTQYLNKQVELNGEKHLKKFKGTAADLGALSAWLQTQKK